MRRIFVLAVMILMIASGCSTANSENTGTDAKADDQATSEQTPAEGVKDDDDESAEEPEDKSSDATNDQTEDDQEVHDKQPEYELSEANWTLQPIDDAEAAVVLLTIDDAPDKYALEMAQTLKELEAQAIFFVNGHFIDTDEEKEVLKQIHDLGFPIGNHTMTHSRLDKLSEEQQYNEIVRLNDEIEAVIGERPQFFRAPFGINTDYSKSIVADEKMLLMNWTYGYDWDKNYMTADAISDIMVNSPYLVNGANLLMHDRQWTNEGLKDIVTGLRAKNYQILDPASIKVPE